MNLLLCFRPCGKNNKISMGCCGKFTLAELTSFTISTMIVFVWIMTGMMQLLSRTTDTRWLNPKFFAAQIQITIPKKGNRSTKMGADKLAKNQYTQGVIEWVVLLMVPATRNRGGGQTLQWFSGKGKAICLVGLKEVAPLNTPDMYLDYRLLPQEVLGRR